MDINDAEEIVYRLIGVSVSFKFFGETIRINPYTTVHLSSSVNESFFPDSKYTIGFHLPNLIPIISFSKFDINPRARELGMKIEGLVEDGEVRVAAGPSYLLVVVNVYKIKFKYGSLKGSITIRIEYPPNPGPRLVEKSRRVGLNEEENNVLEAIGKGVASFVGLLIFEWVKKGLAEIFTGRVGFAFGFA